MKVCFIGNSKNYKTTIANYLWTKKLWYYPPTVGYQIIPYDNHVIYDTSCNVNDKCSPPYHLMDVFVLFLDSEVKMKGKTAEEWYALIREKNSRARILAALSPTSLTECVDLANDIRLLLS